MGGFFGVVSKKDCVTSLFYGTDYHSHLGTRRGGLATIDSGHFIRFIHDISNSPFRSKFQYDIISMRGSSGIGVISDYEDQPLLIGSHLGPYAIVTVGVVKNSANLAQQAFRKRGVHFSEMSGNEINPTELIATLIDQEESFEQGILNVQAQIQGSCSLLLLTHKGIYAARDRFGRTPVIIGKNDDGFAVTMETSALPNLGYAVERDLGPGETVLLTPEGIEQKNPPNNDLHICCFLWIYYGYPASSYEGINVEASRYRCGAALAEDETVDVDSVSGIPDSGIAHALGFAAKSRLRYSRPFVKYTPTWPRSFMPQQQYTRDLIAKMKLIPIRELTEGKRLLFCDDSIVRGTQLRVTLERLYEYGAIEVYLRPACPPLIFGCQFLNFSRFRSELDLAARKAISKLEGDEPTTALERYADDASEHYAAMVDTIGRNIGVTSLRYQKLHKMLKAIGLPQEKVCTYCWTGKSKGLPSSLG